MSSHRGDEDIREPVGGRPRQNTGTLSLAHLAQALANIRYLHPFE